MGSCQRSPKCFTRPFGVHGKSFRYTGRINKDIIRYLSAEIRSLPLNRDSSKHLFTIHNTRMKYSSKSIGCHVLRNPEILSLEHAIDWPLLLKTSFRTEIKQVLSSSVLTVSSFPHPHPKRHWLPHCVALQRTELGRAHFLEKPPSDLKVLRNNLEVLLKGNFFFLLFGAAHLKVPRLGVESELQLPVYTPPQEPRI